MKVAIAGGGTGGHLFPGIAIAQELTARGCDVFFIGNAGRIEEWKVPEYGYPIKFVAGGQVKGVGLLGAIKGLWATLKGIGQAFGILGNQRPDVVVGVGGYASVAGVLGGRLRRIKAVVCEQNSVPGRANRLLARFAKVVCTAFADAEKLLPKKKVRLLGNPIRRDFRQRFADARQLRGIDEKCLFVFGGSQGARKLNYATLDAVELWMKAGRMPRILHQTGSLDYEDVCRRYRQMGAQVEPVEFIDDMPAVYAQADLLLARAGAMSISEIAACGLPAILVPLPSAADDHQRRNAQALVDTGGAIVMDNDSLTGAALVVQVDRLLGDQAALEKMGEAVRSFDRPKAAMDICDQIERLAMEN